MQWISNFLLCHNQSCSYVCYYLLLPNFNFGFLHSVAATWLNSLQGPVSRHIQLLALPCLNLVFGVLRVTINLSLNIKWGLANHSINMYSKCTCWSLVHGHEKMLDLGQNAHLVHLFVIHHWSCTSGESSNPYCVPVCPSIRTHISVTPVRIFLILGMMMGYDMGMMPVISKFWYSLVFQAHRQKISVSEKGSNGINDT